MCTIRNSGFRTRYKNCRLNEESMNCTYSLESFCQQIFLTRHNVEDLKSREGQSNLIPDSRKSKGHVTESKLEQRFLMLMQNVLYGL